MILQQNDPRFDPQPMRPEGAQFVPTFLRRVTSKLSSLAFVNKIAILDLSHWNTCFDFEAIYASGVRCVILRATFGKTGVDSLFLANAEAAHNAGLLVMTYHYQYSQYDGVTQANHHWQTITPIFEVLGYIPVVWNDVEDSGAVVSNTLRLTHTKEFLTRISGLQGKNGRCGIYSSPGFANQFLAPAPAWINDYLQWVAHWWAGAMPTTPNGWHTVPEVWQIGYWDNYAWCEPVPGCEPDIDRNWFFGTLADLMSLAMGEVIVEPPPVEPPPVEPPPVITKPPAPVAFAMVVNDLGVKVRKKPVYNQLIVSSLAKDTIVPVWEVNEKANGEIWVHETAPGDIAGWSAMYYPNYGDDAQLMVWVQPPAQE